MTGYLRALVEVLIVFLAMATCFYGWGRLAARGLRLEVSAALHIWIGWAFALLAFQVVHLFLPLTAYVVIPFFVVGSALAAWQIPMRLRESLKGNSIGWIIAAAAGAVIMACWVAARALAPTTYYDAGLYYFNMVRWINTYPIVPGLGNLHNRLGFNQSFFPYVAALNFFPFFVHGNSFANSFLLLLTLGTLIGALRPVFYQPALLIESHPFRYAPALLALPIVLSMAFSSSGDIAPTPDLTSVFLQIVLIVVLLRYLAPRESTNRGGEAGALAILATTAITIKLSNLVFSAMIIGACAVNAWRKGKTNLRSLLRPAASAVAILLIWGLRGYILTGAPLYPSTIGYLPFKWAVPYQDIITLSKIIYGWARQPRVNWRIVLSSWAWLRPWMITLWREHQVDVVYPAACGLACAALAAMVLVIARKQGNNPAYWMWAILLPSVAGVLYWFFTAPDPRFASGLLWVFAVCSAVLLMYYLRRVLNARLYMATLMTLFVAVNFLLLPSSFPRPAIWEHLSTKGWLPDKTVPLVEKQTRYGLVVYMPKTGDQCWASPLLCTPALNPNLREIVSGDVREGFYIAQPR